MALAVVVGTNTLELEDDPAMVEFVDQKIVARLNALGDLPLVPLDEAVDLVREAREQYPKAFVQWLLAQAPFVVAEKMAMLRAGRESLDGLIAVRRAPQRHFAAVAEQGPAGMLDRLYEADDKLIRLRDMTVADLESAASTQDRKARSAAFEAAFLRALKRALPDDATRVGDVFTEDAIEKMRAA